MLDQYGVTQETGPVVASLSLTNLFDQSGVTHETGSIASPVLLGTMEDQFVVTQETRSIVIGNHGRPVWCDTGDWLVISSNG